MYSLGRERISSRTPCPALGDSCSPLISKSQRQYVKIKGGDVLIAM